VTETCDEDSPHLLIHVETTPATTQDKEVTADIHQGLESLHLLPSEHFADTGYVDGDQLGSLKLDYGIDLVGPVTVDPRGPRQSRARV